jgi:hypothetical protein
MKPNSLYAQLELISEDFPASGSTSSAPSSVVSRLPKRYLHSLGHALVAWLCGSREPHIKVRHNRHSQVLFEVYDPFAQTRHTFYSEQNLRTWLDQRYYQ